MRSTILSCAYVQSDSVRLRDGMRNMIDRYKFTQFVTLALNAPGTSNDRAHRLLKEWDARTCRALIGPKWLKRPDERPVFFAFLESPELNPHWHLLVNATAPMSSDGVEKWSSGDYAYRADREWTRLIPSGTMNIQSVTSGGVNHYVTKELINAECFKNFILPTEFLT